MHYMLSTQANLLLQTSFIIIEVAGALVRCANADRSLMTDMDDVLDEWSALLAGPSIALHRATPESVRETARLANTLGHPLKDCLYLSLAQELRCDFITCDARFAAKAVQIYPRTRTLAG